MTPATAHPGRRRPAVSATSGVHPDRGPWCWRVREDHPRGRGVGHHLVAARPEPRRRPPRRGHRALPAAPTSTPPRSCSPSDRLAWMQWDYPNMPWDTTAIWSRGPLDGVPRPWAPARVAGARASRRSTRAGCPRHPPLPLRPDRGWNLYALVRRGRLRPLHPAEAEFGPPSGSWADPVRGAGPTSWCARSTSTGDSMSPCSRCRPASWCGSPSGSRCSLARRRHGRGRRGHGPPRAAGHRLRADLDHRPGPTSAWPARRSWRPSRSRSPSPVTWPSDRDGSSAGTTRRPTAARRPQGTLPPLITSSHGGPTGCRTAGLPDRVPVLDHPRLRGPRRQLQRQHRLRPAYRQRLHGCVGAADVRGLRRRRAGPWPSRGGPTPTGWRSWAAAPAATPLCAALTTTTSSPPGISQYGIGDLRRWPRHAQVRVALPRRSRRALSRGPRSRPGSLAAAPCRLPGRPDPAAAGRRRQGGAAAPGRGHGRRRPGQRSPGRLDHVRRRGPRLPPSRHHPDGGRGPDLFSEPDPRPPPADDVPPIPIDNLDPFRAPS